jgi:hypothetical protein
MKKQNLCASTKSICLIFPLAIALWLGCGTNSNIALAAGPTVSNVSAPLNDGASLTITGSGFGASGPNVVLFDNFEKGTVGQSIKTGAGSATIGQWNSIDNGDVKYSSDTPHSGSQVFKANDPLSPTCADAPNDAIHALLPNATELYVSWWMYVPTGVPYPGETGYGTTCAGLNWKTVWLEMGGTTSHDQDFVVLGNPSSPGTWILTGNNAIYQSPWLTVPEVTKGQWMHFKWYEKGGTASNGIEKIWKLTSNGLSNFLNATNITNMSSGQYRSQIDINAYVRKHSSGTSPVQLFDDVYVATGPTAQARIEIGNNSSYASCTNLTLATPTNWTDTQITATFRAGSFKAGDNAYLFVIDGSGNISNGLPVNIGQSFPSPANLRKTN